MTPSPSPTTQCPVGHIEKIVNSVIVCVAQHQNQNQDQTQNNNQNQNVNQNVNSQGGSSSSSSSSSSNSNVTINNTYYPSPTPTGSPTATITYIYTNTNGAQVLGYATKAVYTGEGDKGYVPQVVGQVKSSITELPRTGLPLLGLGLAGILPGGLIFRRFSRKGKSEESANSVWTSRQLGK